MTFKRWLPTFLGFPIGGYLAIQIVGSIDDPVSAAAGGLVAGAVIGAGQWLALRSAGIGRRWVGYTAAAMAAGSALAAAVTGAGTEVADVMVCGPRHRRGGRRRAVGAAGARRARRGGLDGRHRRGLVARLAGRPRRSSSTSSAATTSSAPAARCSSTLLTGLALRHVVAGAGRPAPAVAV